jgi:hypothetical protein
MLRYGAEFRTRLIEGQAEEQLLTAMLTLFKERGWLKARGKQRTDSTHVLAKIRAINRLVCVGETLRHALNCLAIVAPEWLLEHSKLEWVDRYGVRLEDSRLPSSEEERQAWVEPRWTRWERSPQRPVCSKCSDMVTGSAGDRYFAPGLAAKLSMDRWQAQLALIGEHPSR